MGDEVGLWDGDVVGCFEGDEVGNFVGEFEGGGAELLGAAVLVITD